MKFATVGIDKDILIFIAKISGSEVEFTFWMKNKFGARTEQY